LTQKLKLANTTSTKLLQFIVYVNIGSVILPFFQAWETASRSRGRPRLNAATAKKFKNDRGHGWPRGRPFFKNGRNL